MLELELWQKRCSHPSGQWWPLEGSIKKLDGRWGVRVRVVCMMVGGG